ncbi:MAG: DUF2087 domain-containing protein [Myxococcales bacterium]|nr:DUF2087 domain-containing protein [Myxococcales bacterium]
MLPLDHATLDDLTRGFVTDEHALRCLYCDTIFDRGLVYPDGDRLRTAPSAAAAHVDQAHGGPFEALLATGRGTHGLSDVHQTLLCASAKGASDSEIAQALGGRALSTIRNHRLQLRRKAREAKVLLALMELLEKPMHAERPMIAFHPTLPVSDDRTRISVAEAAKLLDKYFEDPKHTVLTRIPKREKHKLVVLRRLVDVFETGRRYTEQEVNQRLARAHPDTAALRRYLVDYRFLARLPDGRAYWRIDHEPEG